MTEIALIDGDRTIQNNNWISDYNEAEKMIPQVISLLKEQSFGSEDLIFVVCGPGSYTGLRVGVTAANIVGMLTKTPITSLNTFDYLHARILQRTAELFDQQRKSEEKTAVILKAGGPLVALTSEYGAAPQQVPLNELSDRLTQDKVVAYFTERDEIAAEINRSNPEMRQIRFEELQPLDLFLLNLTRQSALGQPERQKMIQPVYLNPPAITKPKKQHIISP